MRRVAKPPSPPMSCCGKQRANLRLEKPRPHRVEVRPIASAVGSGVPASTRVLFQYTGQTGLTVMGPVSGRRYRFDSPKAIVEVDTRDAPALTTVPRLQRVQSADSGR